LVKIKAPSGRSALTEIVVGLFIALTFDGFGLMVGIENHSGKSAIVTIFTPPAGAKHRGRDSGDMAFAMEVAFGERLRAGHGTEERGCVDIWPPLPCDKNVTV